MNLKKIRDSKRGEPKDYNVYNRKGVGILLMDTYDGEVKVPENNPFNNLSDEDWKIVKAKIHEATDSRKYGREGYYATYPVAVFLTDHAVDDREGEKILGPLVDSGTTNPAPGWAFDPLDSVDLGDKVATIGETFI